MPPVPNPRRPPRWSVDTPAAISSHRAPMRRVTLPASVLAGEARRGRFAAGGGLALAFGGTLGGALAGAATASAKPAEGTSDSVGLAFPTDSCCNCLADGATTAELDSALTVSRGTDYTLRVQVPYCADCAPTAKRQKPNALGVFANLLTLAVLLGFCAMGVAIGLGVEQYGLGFVAGLPLSALVLGIWYATRRPGPRQTSYYQAVRLASIDLSFSGQIRGAELIFSNDSYYERFAKINPKLVH
jgi:hypothetical protein